VAAASGLSDRAVGTETVLTRDSAVEIKDNKKMKEPLRLLRGSLWLSDGKV
jgi:hypothetical protein